MKKTFYLEGERITLKRAKELLGERKYKRFTERSKAIFLSMPNRSAMCFPPMKKAPSRVRSVLSFYMAPSPGGITLRSIVLGLNSTISLAALRA